jgi:hypothetical protein
MPFTNTCWGEVVEVWEFQYFLRRWGVYELGWKVDSKRSMSSKRLIHK